MLRPFRKKSRGAVSVWLAACVAFFVCTFAAGIVWLSAAGGAAMLIENKSPFIAEETLKPDKGLHGVWVTTVGNTDFPSSQGLSADAQKKEADAILDKVKSLGLNAVFLQVRPNSDALYKSSVYPWSAVLTGTQGKDPGYDPLGYFVSGAHKRGLKLMAWVNPYRVQAANNITQLSASNPASVHADWAVTTADGQMFYDPGLPQVRAMIENGVTEIVNNYDVDGVVFDDYFYPEKSFDDANTYKTYGNGLALDEFRRKSVNTLIQEIHDKLKAAKKTVMFGVSPAGVWANRSQNPLGSDTINAYSSYYDQYADTRLWVKSGWVDFICPQIYWATGNANTDYTKLLAWWADTVKGTDVSLYIAHAASKAGGSETGWQSPDQLVLQLCEAQKYGEYKGSVFYDYADLCKNTGGCAELLSRYYSGKLTAASFGKQLSISSPAGDVTTGEGHIKITGGSDANFPLLVNGQSVDRSPDGYFSVTVNLSPGKNTVTLSHKGQTKALTVTYNVEVLRSVQPSHDITANGGAQINITAEAHSGATVYATVGGVRVDMVKSDSPGNDNGDNSAGNDDDDSDFATYSGIYTLPEASGIAQDLGKISVVALWGGFEKTMQGADVQVNQLVVNTGQSCIATITPGSSVNKQFAETFLYADNMYRPTAYPQPTGEWDTVELNADGTPKVYYFGSMSYYRLSCGLMLYSGDVKIKAGKAPEANRIKGVRQGSADSGRYTEFVFDFTSKITYNAATDVAYQRIGYNTNGKRDYSVSSFNADSFSITFFNTAQAAPISVVKNPLISSVSYVKENATTVKYTFKLKNAGKFYGTNIYYNSAGDLVIDFKNPWDGKLSDLRLSLDPGHGGIDFGAVAGGVNEKTLNLSYALAVRDILIKTYGLKPSNIYMTRTTDTLIAPSKGADLQLRTLKMINFHSDLSLCIHQNDGGGEGFETYYFQPYSQQLAACVQSDLASAYKKCGYKAADRGYKFSSETAYYACRQIQFPSILVECGFIDNARDRGWLTSVKGKNAIAAALAKSVVDYANLYMR